jgi:hypothetical protein
MFDHSQIDFTVKKTALFYDNETYSPSYGDRMEGLSYDIGMLLKREDTNQPIAIVTEGYTPVQYMDIVGKVEEALSLSGLDMADAEFETNVYDNGAKLELRAKFPANEMFLDGNSLKSDAVIPEFCFRTSHNSTWANNGMMGLWRSKCWNTLVSGDKLAYVYGRHTKNFNVPAFASKIGNAGKYIAGKGLNQMKEWYHKEISRDATIDLFTKTLAKRTDNVTRKTVPNKVMLSNLMKIFDEENRHLHGRSTYESYATRTKGTLWSAYQAATHWSSHDNSNVNSKPAHNVIGIREDRVRKMLHSDEWLALAA